MGKSSETLYSIELKGKSPYVVLPLKQYRLMLEYIDDLEDKMALRQRKNEESVAWDITEKKFNKKFGAK